MKLISVVVISAILCFHCSFATTVNVAVQGGGGGGGGGKNAAGGRGGDVNTNIIVRGRAGIIQGGINGGQHDRSRWPFSGTNGQDTNVGINPGSRTGSGRYPRRMQAANNGNEGENGQKLGSENVEVLPIVQQLASLKANDFKKPAHPSFRYIYRPSKNDANKDLRIDIKVSEAKDVNDDKKDGKKD